VSRCAVVQDVASDCTSIDVRRRDATDRRWLAGSAAARRATGATTTAKVAKQTVSRAEALIGTNEDAELVAQRKHLE
jgi:hypothetical protein